MLQRMKSTILFLLLQTIPTPAIEFTTAVKAAGATWSWCYWCTNGPREFLQVERPDPSGKIWPCCPGRVMVQQIVVATPDFTLAQKTMIQLIREGKWRNWEDYKYGVTNLHRWVVRKDGTFYRENYTSGVEDCRHYYTEAAELDRIRFAAEQILIKIQLYNACVMTGGRK